MGIGLGVGLGRDHGQDGVADWGRGVGGEVSPRPIANNDE